MDRLIKKHRVFMDTAKLMSSLSTCIRHNVGAIIVTEDNSQIVGIGYNGNYSGGKNCCEINEPGLCGCIHAEQNALLKFSSIIYKNAKMFTTLSPCLMCAKLIVNAGIKSVYYKEDYRNLTPLSVLRESGVCVEKLNWIILIMKLS